MIGRMALFHCKFPSDFCLFGIVHFGCRVAVNTELFLRAYLPLHVKGLLDGYDAGLKMTILM